MSDRTPDAIYKYCSAESAKAILTARSLCWKASHLLGDPLEPSHFSPLGFNYDELLKNAIKTAASLIFAREAPKGNAPLLAAIRRWRDEERFAGPEEAEAVLKDLMSQMVDQRKEAIEKIMSDWKVLTRKLRICSFLAKPDNLVAWQTYADHHTGVVLRFQTQGSECFADAVPVTYSPVRAAITTLKEQLSVILTNEKHTAQTQFLEKFSSKAMEYKGEGEVRCFYQQDEAQAPIDAEPANWKLDRAFGSEDLKGIYFGVATSLKDKQELWDLVKKNYTAVKIHDTKLVLGKYELEQERITDKPV